MPSRRARFLSMALGGVLAVAIVCWAIRNERLLDAIHAARTGYYFTWMPEGVVPGDKRAINDAGHVAVELLEGQFRTRAAFWSIEERRVRRLGTPGDPAFSSVVAIGEDGSILGVLKRNIADVGRTPLLQSTRGFIWSASADMVEIPAVVGGKGSLADMNRRGEVVGCFTTVEQANVDATRAFRWTRDSGIETLDAPSSCKDTYAYRISDDGWIVGFGRPTADTMTPVLWQPGRPARDLGLPPGYATGYGQGINSRGQVLVTLFPRGARVFGEPFVWCEEKGYKALPRPDGCTDVIAIDLNDLGHVLLRAKRMSDGAGAGYLIVNGEVRPLPEARLGVSTVYTGMNDLDWLTGYVNLREGLSVDFRRGFIARP